MKQLFNLQIQKYAGPIGAKGTQESGHEGEALAQPANPVHRCYQCQWYPGSWSRRRSSSSIQSTGVISANNLQVRHEGEALVQPLLNTGQSVPSGTPRSWPRRRSSCSTCRSKLHSSIANGTQSWSRGGAWVQPANQSTLDVSANGTQKLVTKARQWTTR